MSLMSRCLGKYQDGFRYKFRSSLRIDLHGLVEQSFLEQNKNQNRIHAKEELRN